MHAARGVVVDFAELSDPGRDPSKQNNEDSAGSAETPLGLLAVVCDGMGGHADGKEASLAAVQSIVEGLNAASSDAPATEALRSAIEAAGRAVHDLGGGASAGVRPGSTVVAVLLSERGAEVAHVGDSRVYLLRGGSIQRLTRDHSMVQHMVDAGLLSADDAHKHPDANRITRALGMQPEVDVEVRSTPVPLQVNDVFLLCSDGLTDMLSDSEILKLVSSSIYSGPGLSCQHLVEQANQRGGHDNITVQLLRVVEAPVRRPPAEPTQVDVRHTLVDDTSSAEATLEMRRGVQPQVGAVSGEAPAPTLVDYGLVRPTEPSIRSGVPAHGARRSGRNLVLLGLSIVAAVVIGIVLWWLVGGQPKPREEVVPMPSGLELRTRPAESTILIPETPPAASEDPGSDLGNAAPAPEQAAPIAPAGSAGP